MNVIRMKRKWVMVIVAAGLILLWTNAARLLSLLSSTLQQKDTLSADSPVISPTPPMGWNSWNYFRCDNLHEDVVRGVADALVRTGLAAAGYVYVNIDDCWQIDRNATGHLVEDPDKFPSGMKHLGEYLHNKGLKFGIYSDFGTLTCKRRPGSYQHEVLDVASFSSWGVDYIKNDGCWLYPCTSPLEHISRFSEALHAGPRPIVHSIRLSIPVKEAGKYCNVKRVAEDVYHEWESGVALMDKFVGRHLWRSARPGFWHDIDMLEVGNGDMTLDENVCHMIIWCAFKSPLLLGNDVRTMSPSILSLLTHDELLAINQDSLGRSVQLVWEGHPENGLAGERVVSALCDPKLKDMSQQWRYNAATHSIESVGHAGSCLAAKKSLEDRLLAVIRKCDKKDRMQRWHINETSNQLELLGIPGQCLTTSITDGVASRVRGCAYRQTLPYYKGPNQKNYYFNDAFEFVKTEASTITIKNLVNRCARVGDHDELQVFVGPLSNNRFVAVLLNRDEIQHDIVLQREHFADIEGGIPTDSSLDLRDAYRRQNVGALSRKDGYKASLRPHSAMALVGTLHSSVLEPMKA